MKLEAGLPQCFGVGVEQVGPDVDAGHPGEASVGVG
jgi:hypothetical protein